MFQFNIEKSWTSRDQSCNLRRFSKEPLYLTTVKGCKDAEKEDKQGCSKEV
jgi:hypothetical protein